MKNLEYYKVLDTKLFSKETWWDSLKENLKLEVGSFLLLTCRISANYKWNIRSNFSGLTKAQQKLVTFAFNKRFDSFTIVDTVKNIYI